MLDKTIESKYEYLKQYIADKGSLAVAFSGGVDSTLLMKVVADVLGEKAVAITAKSISFPEREHKESEDFCKDNGIKQIVVEVDQMRIEGFKNNPPDRCYLCKRVIFDTIINAARGIGIANVAEGSNKDDDGDYRPGMRAIKELGVFSPLKDAGLSKDEIRKLSKELGLPTWKKPSYACLATRFVYGQEITEDAIRMVGDAEQFLFDLGHYFNVMILPGAVFDAGIYISVQPYIGFEIIREHAVALVIGDLSRSVLCQCFFQALYSFVAPACHGSEVFFYHVCRANQK